MTPVQLQSARRLHHAAAARPPSAEITVQAGDVLNALNALHQAELWAARAEARLAETLARQAEGRMDLLGIAAAAPEERT